MKNPERKNAAGAVARKYKIKMMVLFGSVAANKARKDSDADIAISQTRQLSLQRELLLRHDLSKIFDREIDIVSLNRAGPLLLGEIGKNGVLLYGSAREFSKFRINAMKAFFDFAPYFRLQEETINKRLNNLTK